MAVNVQREGRSRVTQVFLNHLDAVTALNGGNRVTVPEIMKTHIFLPDGSERALAVSWSGYELVD